MVDISISAARGAGGLSSEFPSQSLATPRLPHQRAADIQVVSPKPDAGDFDTLKGLTFNRWDPSDGGLYVTDPFHLRLIRIDVTTGQRTVLAADPLLFNFPVSAKFLPPVRGRPTIVISSDQEHRFAALNAALNGVSVFQFPFSITGGSCRGTMTIEHCKRQLILPDFNRLSLQPSDEVDLAGDAALLRSHFNLERVLSIGFKLGL